MNNKSKRNDEFRWLYLRGLSVSEIARKTGWSKETVRLAVKDLPKYKENTKNTKNTKNVKNTKNTKKDVSATVDTKDKLSYLQNQFSNEKGGVDDESSLKDYLDEENDIKWIANSAMVTISINGKIYQADSTHGNFKEIIDRCVKDDFDCIESLFNIGKFVEEFSSGLFTFEYGDLKYAGEILHGVLVQKIIEDIRDGKRDVDKYMHFLEHCLENQQNSIDELWEFLKHNDIKINDDGFIIGYKKVTNINGQLFDSHTRTVINDVGTVVKMPRMFVNDNKHETCSFGLHVGSLSYVKDFNGNTIIKVLVNPADVVSVPIDYNGEKMRCSEYVVIEQLDDNLNSVKEIENITGVALVNRTGMVQYTKENK